MKHLDFMSWIGSVFGTIFTALQTEKIFQLVSLILTILATLVSIAFTVWKWYDKAKADGQITADEVKELSDSVKEHVEDLKDEISEAEALTDAENKKED